MNWEYFNVIYINLRYFVFVCCTVKLMSCYYLTFCYVSMVDLSKKALCIFEHEKAYSIK